MQLDLLRRARHAPDSIALDFMVMNESYLLADYRQAALWLRDRGTSVLSGVASVERNAPYVQWLDAVCETLPRQGGQTITASDLSEPLQSQWAEWLPAHGLWVPIHLPGHVAKESPGGILFARDDAWTTEDVARLEDWIGAWALVRERLAPMTRRGAFSKRSLSFSTGWMVALALVAGLFLIRVPLSVIASGEIIAREPMPVRAPIDGVVREIHVQPNQSVRVGDPLFTFDIVQLASKLEVATQALRTAEAELQQYDQQALSDPKARASLAAARGNVVEKRAEVDYLRSQRGRARVLAAEDGIAIFDDPQEWIGKPVGTGERIMRIASDQRKEIEAWVPVGDAIPLPTNAPARLYVSASPMEPALGSVHYMAHDAVRRPDGTYAYRVRAALDQPTSHRIGLKGTVHLSGERVTLAYWVFRRPLGAVREFFGF